MSGGRGEVARLGTGLAWLVSSRPESLLDFTVHIWKSGVILKSSKNVW